MHDYYLGEIRDSYKYVEKMSRYGLTKFSPLIITVAPTGGVQGAEANPNLPEKPQDQAQSIYDAYNAGASMVHIHARDAQNLTLASSKAEEFAEINALVRDKCPDIIVNNSCVGGRMWDQETGVMGPQLLACIDAEPEVASLDVNNFSVAIPLGERKAPLYPERAAGEKKRLNFVLTEEDAISCTQAMNAKKIKPEFEIFNSDGAKYINMLIKKGLTEPPYWCSAIFNGNGTWPTAQSMMNLANSLPHESLLNVIAIGAAQFPILTMAIIMGFHVRVGLEDNVNYGPKELAKSNAQMVDRVVRIAKELGRPIATPQQAREMMGLGEPRKYPR